MSHHGKRGCAHVVTLAGDDAAVLVGRGVCQRQQLWPGCCCCIATFTGDAHTPHKYTPWPDGHAAPRGALCDSTPQLPDARPLEQDFLKGGQGVDQKGQLREILSLLKAAPSAKRPACLDRPPVTSTAGRAAAQGQQGAGGGRGASGAQQQQQQQGGGRPSGAGASLSERDAAQLLALLEDGGADDAGTRTSPA